MPRIQAQCAQTVDKSPPAERFSADCATVIVPAHNEARGIAAAVHQASSAISCLNALPGFPNIELVIACNGCSDDTALIARQAAPCAQVLDLAARGIACALNVALSASSAGPVIAVDADVSLNALELATLLEALTDEDVLAVSPPVHYALDGLSVPVSTAFPHAPASASASFRPSPQMENLAAVYTRPTPSDASIETSPASR